MNSKAKQLANQILCFDLYFVQFFLCFPSHSPSHSHPTLTNAVKHLAGCVTPDGEQIMGG